MKSKYIMILAAATVLLYLNSCKKVLEKQDLGNFSTSQVFADSAVAKLDMDYIYGQNQPGWYGVTGGGAVSAAVTGLSDETASTNVYVQGTVNSDTEGDIGTKSTAGPYYFLSTINAFVQNMNAGPLPIAVKRRFNAQAYFWRAWRYFELAKIYGGVPLVTTVLPVVGNDAKNAALIPRATTTATFKQIISDLDSAIAYLPAKWPDVRDYGRLTSGAAAAYLGRVLLTYASPQFNPNNDQSRWQAAYDMNTKAIQILSGSGYGLYKSFDYTMWTSTESAYSNPEAVMITEYNTNLTTDGIYGNNNTYEASVRPTYLTSSGGGSNAPSYDISYKFPMADGKLPGDVTGKYTYSLQSFYKNRDPRFYQTIAYNGANWPLQVTLANGTFNGYIWTYYYPTGAVGTTTNASTEPKASGSGFYLRKAVNPTTALGSLPNSGLDWIEIRYAEVLLNQAECAAELGNFATATSNLIAIRKRAGIESGDGTYGLGTLSSHDAAITAIMNERAIELAFEGKRYWDLRRRRLLESTLNGKPRSRIVVTLANKGTKNDYILSTRDASALTPAGLDALYASTFQVSVQAWDTFNVSFQPADYFFGIPLTSWQNNGALIQNNTWPNNGYGNGLFDPLK